MRKISSVIAALLAAAMLCSCSAESAEDTSADDVPEEVTVGTDPYYRRSRVLHPLQGTEHFNKCL